MARTVRMAVAIALVAGSLSVHAQVAERKPKLIVLLMVDQMRADYVDKFQTQWSGGLHRLVSAGAWFRQASYPFFDTVTCAGHTTVTTGTLPSTHGMVMNEWWDRDRHVEVPCTEDRTVSPLSYGKPVSGPGDSARAIRVPSIADELKAQLSPAPRVIALSLKARSAIPMGGRAPDAVAWFDDTGTWVTSTAFAKSPVPAVADFIRRHPVEADFDKVWERSLPLSAYLYDQVAAGANVPEGRTASFPHPLKARSHGAEPADYDRWQDSPFSDEYVAEMALDVASQMRVGQGSGPDVLAVSFSALDKVGHDFGPNSHEIQDVLVRLDRTLERFFSRIERLAGGDYVVVLSGDHGVAPLPEWLGPRGIRSGRISDVALAEAIQTTLFERLGSGHYVSGIVNGDVYMSAGVLDRLLASAPLLDAVRQSLKRIPGVQDVVPRDRLALGAARDDTERRLARSYDAERSGDLFIVQAPYWTIRDKGTGHGSPYDYDSHVPIFMMGKGIVAGEYLAPASPADIAPTLAFLAGITLPQAQGRVLTEALGPVKASR